MPATSRNPSIKKRRLVYVTSSSFKIEENRVFQERCRLADGVAVKELFAFDIRNTPIPETLEVDLNLMVRAEAAKAYSIVGVPCIVEHAGLISHEYRHEGYPGGLTKPMWNTLRGRFLTETNSAGRRAIARAVVGYCDGKQTLTFTGETAGRLAKSPKGRRDFYWDTVFIPDGVPGRGHDKTYAQLVDNPSFGLKYKIEKLSQSSRAMLMLLEFLKEHPEPELWSWGAGA
jgi:XTP/dITP diphosphohydrolase